MLWSPKPEKLIYLGNYSIYKQLKFLALTAELSMKKVL